MITVGRRMLDRLHHGARLVPTGSVARSAVDRATRSPGGFFISATRTASHSERPRRVRSVLATTRIRLPSSSHPLPRGDRPTLYSAYATSPRLAPTPRPCSLPPFFLNPHPTSE